MAKIAITGAMGVGKTTLATQLSEATGIKLLPEVARMMIEEGHRLDLEVTPALELLMAIKQAKLEKEESFIADRCFIDILAYVMVLFPNHTKLADSIEERLVEANYGIILSIPIEFGIEDDGVRSTDIKFQRAIDRKIKSILKSMKHYVIRGSVEQRVQKALDIIQTYDGIK